MNPEFDYYAVLGILPDAEDVVVVAAYRALASRYHPDRWKGDVAEATRRMAELNGAYGVLSDAVKRREYDASRKVVGQTFDEEDKEKDAAFDRALEDLEERWQIAVGIFPDLKDIRERLEKTAHRLAFSFVTMILETKRFQNRNSIAVALEKEFLEQHFGTDVKIIEFARRLVEIGRQDAIVALNQYVDVLGSGIDAARVIARIETDFKLVDSPVADLGKRQRSRAAANDQAEISRLKASVKKHRREHEAAKLIALLGYDMQVYTTGLFAPRQFDVWIPESGKPRITLNSPVQFMEWVLTALCD
jgi:hypothetical protein